MSEDALERMTDALDHVMRVARNCARPTRRLYWIRARCQSAIDGDEAWRDYDYPKMRNDDYKELVRLRELLEQAECPDRDCDEGIVHRGRLRENWHTCEWCAVKKELLE